MEKGKVSHQKKKPHEERKSLTGKEKSLLTVKEKVSQRKEMSHAERKFLTTKQGKR